MSELVPGDTVYITVWTGANCGPGYKWEIRGQAIDLDYQPTDVDRASDSLGYLDWPGPYVLVALKNRPPVIVALDAIRIWPTPP